MKKISLLKSEKKFGRGANWIVTVLSLLPVHNKKLN